MYIAYYIMRSDSGADLCAVIENGESIFDGLASDLLQNVEKELENAFEEWFTVEDPSCDFPDVWDLTSSQSM